jgi:hypothetical protein
MNEILKELLVCKYENCNKYFEDPIVLCCGQTICRSHINNLLDESNIKDGKYICKMCKELHEIHQDCFIIRWDINDLIQSDNHLPDKQIEVKELYLEFQNTVKDLNKLVNEPLTYLDDYISDLKKKVELQREELKLKIDEIALDMIFKINKLDEQCKKDIKKYEKEDTITQFNQDLLIYKDCHRVAYIEQEKLSNLEEELKYLIDESKQKLDYLEKKLFKGIKCKFEKPSKSFLNSDFGVFTHEEEVELEELLCLNGHNEQVNKILSIDKHRLASCSDDNTIKLWCSKSGKCLKTLNEHYDSVNTICSLSGNRLASGSDDKTVKIWNLEKYKCDETLDDCDSPICSLIQINDYLLGGLENGDIIIWDLEKFEYVTTLNEHTNRVNCLFILPNNQFASASSDHTIKIWSLENLKEPLLSLNEHTDGINALKMTKDGCLISISKDRTIKIWDKNVFNCIKSLKNDSEIFRFEVLSEDDYLLIGDLNDQIKLCNIKNSNECAKTFYCEDFSDFILLLNGNLAITSGSKIKIFQNKFFN